MQDRSLKLNQGGTGCKLLTECKGEIAPNEIAWRKAAWTSIIFSFFRCGSLCMRQNIPGRN